MRYLQTIELYRGLVQYLGIPTRFLVVLRPYFFSHLYQYGLPPATVITLDNQEYLNPSGVNNRNHTGWCQRGFVSFDLREPLSLDPKDYHFLER